MAKYFSKPFASNGTRTSIPDDPQSDGLMSFLEGWGYDYERHPIDDPAAKHIERGKMNFLFYVITEALGELQRLGSSTWDETRIPYGKGAVVFYADVTWVSTVAANNSRPGLTDDWKNIALSGNGGGSTPSDGYTNDDIDNMFRDVDDRINAITLHNTGDIYGISRTTVVENEYICNGDTVPIESLVGSALSLMPTAFKDAWGIKMVGTKRIKLPMLIGKSEVDGFFTTPIFSPGVGFDRTKTQYYASDSKLVAGTVDVPPDPSNPTPTEPVDPETVTIPNVQHYQPRFTPVIWLNPDDGAAVPAGATILFEGTDSLAEPVSTELTIRQVRIGIYNSGQHYIDMDATPTATLNSISFKDKADAVVSLGGEAVTATVSNEVGMFVLITLPKTLTVAKMSINITCDIPEFNGGDNLASASLVLIDEPLI